MFCVCWSPVDDELRGVVCVRPTKQVFRVRLSEQSHRHRHTHTRAHAHIAAKSKPDTRQDSVFRTRKTLCLRFRALRCSTSERGKSSRPWFPSHRRVVNRWSQHLAPNRWGVRNSGLLYQMDVSSPCRLIYRSALTVSETALWAASVRLEKLQDEGNEGLFWAGARCSSELNVFYHATKT